MTAEPGTPRDCATRRCSLASVRSGRRRSQALGPGVRCAGGWRHRCRAQAASSSGLDRAPPGGCGCRRRTRIRVGAARLPQAQLRAAADRQRQHIERPCVRTSASPRGLVRVATCRSKHAMRGRLRARRARRARHRRQRWRMRDSRTLSRVRVIPVWVHSAITRLPPPSPGAIRTDPVTDPPGRTPPRSSRSSWGRPSGRGRVLHDRRIPGSRANIDHLAVTPSGV